eukprot:760567-Hanusia_phi.AAC.1
MRGDRRIEEGGRGRRRAEEGEKGLRMRTRARVRTRAGRKYRKRGIQEDVRTVDSQGEVSCNLWSSGDSERQIDLTFSKTGT